MHTHTHFIYTHAHTHTHTHTHTHMSSVTMVWYTLRLQMEDTPTGYGGDLRMLNVYWWTVDT